MVLINGRKNPLKLNCLQASPHEELEQTISLPVVLTGALELPEMLLFFFWPNSKGFDSMIVKNGAFIIFML